MRVKALKNFRENLRSVLDHRDISQREIAERADLSYPYISRILMEHVEPSLPICDKIADALKIPLSDLLSKPKDFKDTLLTEAVSR